MITSNMYVSDDLSIIYEAYMSVYMGIGYHDFINRLINAIYAIQIFKVYKCIKKIFEAIFDTFMCELDLYMR